MRDGNVALRRQLERQYALAFLSEVAVVLGWHQGLCIVALPVEKVSLGRCRKPTF
jgi:hypothetical protein